MTDFSHLKKADIKETALVDYPLTMLEGKMQLTLSPATEENKPYFNALLKKNKKMLRSMQGKNITVGVIDENREFDRELFSKYVIKSWMVNDAVGNPVDFSSDAVLDFLTQLPDWIFDDIRKFASDPTNFTNDALDVEEEAKNL